MRCDIPCFLSPFLPSRGNKPQCCDQFQISNLNIQPNIHGRNDIIIHLRLPKRRQSLPLRLLDLAPLGLRRALLGHAARPRARPVAEQVLVDAEQVLLLLVCLPLLLLGLLLAGLELGSLAGLELLLALLELDFAYALALCLAVAAVELCEAVRGSFGLGGYAGGGFFVAVSAEEVGVFV